MRPHIVRLMDAPALDLADPVEQQLAQEYLAMKTRLTEARERADRLRRLADHMEARVAEEEHVLRELEGALGMRAQLQIEQLDRALSGRRVTEVAIAVLQRELQPGQVVHYKDWFALLQAAGFRVAAKDPLGSFLAHVSRCSQVESLGDRSGRYRLRAA